MHDESNVGRWLLLLRDGTEAEQQLARTELGLILEARGLLDEAAEAFERNVAEGTTDRRPYERLAAIARLRGDTAAEARALRGLAELLLPSPPPPAPAPVVSEPEPDYPLPAFLAAPDRAEQDERAEAADEAVASADASDSETLAPPPVHDDSDKTSGTSASTATVSPLAASPEDSTAAEAPAAEDDPATSADEPTDADEPVETVVEVDETVDEGEPAGAEESTGESVVVDEAPAASEDADDSPAPGKQPPSDERSADADEPVAVADAAVTDPDAPTAQDAPGARTIEDDALPATDAAAAPTDDAPEEASDDVPATAAAEEPPQDGAAPSSDEPAAPVASDDPVTVSAETDFALDPETLLAGAPPPQLPPAPLLPLRDDADLSVPFSPLSAPERGAGGVRSPGDAPLDADVQPDETPIISTLPAPGAPSKPAFWRWVPTLIGLVLVILVVGGALMVPVSRPLSVAPAKPAPSSPTAAQQQLLAAPATVQPSPSPSPAAVVVASPEPSPVAVAAPLPARCADAALRFPETQDSEAAVRAAFREYMTRQGVTIDVSSSEFRGRGEAYAARHGEVLAGWMAVTLQRERRDLPTFPLVDYVASDIIVAAGPGEFRIQATVSPQGWNELRALPADSCEGAFLKSPENARWVELMQASVGDITWALPTPQPRR